jgi:hypothetical protein
MALFTLLGMIVVAAPTFLVVVLGGASILGRPLSEDSTSRLVRVSIIAGLLASITVLGLMLSGDQKRVPIDLGNWVQLEDHTPGTTLAATPHSVPHEDHAHYHFSFKLEFDRLSVPLVILTFLLCGTIGAFADKYMHREIGFNRFYVLYAIFVLGMVLTSLAGTIETLFTGWELVGLSSTLLVAFYHERPNPCRNGLRVWIVYRLSDAGLLLAALLLHHQTGEGDFDKLMGTGAWPEGVATLTSGQAFNVGVLLLIAVAGKSAQIPFSGWLPRAMEGPTPSSAVFYGALSVHLGAFLLLRVSPLIALSTPLAMLIVVLGLTSALFAAFAGRVQTDIKSALSFASLTQLGFIVAEIGFLSWLGKRIHMPTLLYIPLIHILGHACARTLQFVRAPTLLHDYRVLENAIGTRLVFVPPRWAASLPERWRTRLYRLALHRGNLDAVLIKYIVDPLVSSLHWLDGVDRRVANRINGEPASSIEDSV